MTVMFVNIKHFMKKEKKMSNQYLTMFNG